MYLVYKGITEYFVVRFLKMRPRTKCLLSFTVIAIIFLAFDYFYYNRSDMLLETGNGSYFMMKEIFEEKVKQRVLYLSVILRVQSKRESMCPEAENKTDESFNGFNTHMITTFENDDIWTKYNDSNEHGIFCPLVPPDLGRVSFHVDIGAEYTLPYSIAEDVYRGGIYKPADCIARQAVAIIVAYPYADKNVRLSTFLYAIHPFLTSQQLEYQLFVVRYAYDLNPAGKDTRCLTSPGHLMNIGVIEADRDRPQGWDCYVFHHPELYPMDSRNLYRCGETPRQLVSSLIWFTFERYGDKAVTKVFRKKNKPSDNLLTEVKYGGVLAMTREQLEAVNGFSNDPRQLSVTAWPSSKIQPNMTLARSRLLVSQYGYSGFFLLTPPPFAYSESLDVIPALRGGLLTAPSTYTVLTRNEKYLYTQIIVNETVK